MKQLICICAAVIFLAASPAMAAMTGNELKVAADDGEKHPNSYPDGVFDGYVTGILEGTSTKLCIPDGVATGQAMVVVRKYLKDHPEGLPLPAASISTGSNSNRLAMQVMRGDSHRTNTYTTSDSCAKKLHQHRAQTRRSVWNDCVRSGRSAPPVPF
jgi:hypothetical protein